MLSHHEQRELERIQDWFEHDDPHLARALGEVGSVGGLARSRTLRYAIDALAIGLIILGAMTLNFGLIFFGAVCLAAAACLHVTRWSETTPRHRRLE
ncbi:DUF3040 domain-containing protein [Saccharomonospora xinjiangensis]|uniref:DUF3040 domain-containing protein n=1 Tax=Saccharomonospora xinjiangensis XJ-54 TaxID=882086 RepID=I0UZW6_9PSEU|nr:DUF3040 domain-containing protein [Saccharomonospora xinjiangensis]EID53419.1 Protein of unknown function (DUF3040) [Saccharomonospora xinjiangensis XJ-54]QBQ59278.1 hypothetical protein EYD13_04525 [Saccharomonospora xinjiangensis]